MEEYGRVSPEDFHLLKQRTSQIEDELQSIKERNKRVEHDKAWETSWCRRLGIALLTYAAAVLFLKLIDAPNYALSAVVPTAGYLFSTLSLPILKDKWIARRKKKVLHS